MALMEQSYVRRDVYERDVREFREDMAEVKNSLRTMIRFAATNVAVLIAGILAGVVVAITT